MSDRYKILSQVDINTILPEPFEDVDIYIVPVTSGTDYTVTPIGGGGSTNEISVSPKAVSINTQTLLTSVVFSFDGAGVSISGDLKLNDGVTGSATSYLMKNLVFYDKQNSALEVSMPLPPGASLIFSPTAYTSGNLYVTAFGIELETGYGPS